MEIDLAFFSCGDPEDILQKLRPPGAVQACNAQDFSLFRHERYVAELGVGGSQSLYLQQRLSHHVVLLRIQICKFTAYHQLDDLIHCQILRRLCGDPLAIAHDGNVIRDP